MQDSTNSVRGPCAEINPKKKPSSNVKRRQALVVAASKWLSTMPPESTAQTGRRKHGSCVDGPT